MKPAERSILRSATGWWLVAACVAEFFLFDRFGSHRVTGIYPRWNDQIQYLSEAYTGYEYARMHGFAAGLWHTLVNPSAQGTLHDFAAVIAFQFVQPSRSAALALNMIAVIAWQLVLFVAIFRRFVGHDGSQDAVAPASRSSSFSAREAGAVAFAAALLPVALRGPWLNLPGSTLDFRLDHFALCALGTSSAVALLTNGFRSRRWAVGFGIAVGLTLLTRFITGTYLLVAFVAFAVWIAVGNERISRLLNLAIAGVVAAVMAGPIFWLNREWVWNYYYIGHYVGPESAIRNQNFGIVRSLQFVWGFFADRHMGPWFVVISAATLVAFLAARAISRIQKPERPPPPAPPGRPAVSDLFVVGGTFLLSPALVLTLHPQKSDVVLSALAPGLVVLVVGFWIWGVRGVRFSAPWASRAIRCIAVLCGLSCLTYFSVRQFGPVDDPVVVANLRQVNGLADYIFSRREAAHLERPRVAVDYITDALDAQVLRVVCYERHHVWIDFDMRLPTGIAEPEAKLVQERVADSDFVFLIGDDVAFGSFPYDKKLRQMRPELRVWCDTHLVVAKRFAFWGHPILLYQRRQIPLEPAPRS